MHVKSSSTRITRHASPPSPPPKPDLRDAQADLTRTRILEALVRTIGGGVANLSMPAVAREAGVSVPTIYRHFGTKAGLVDALGPYVVRKAGLWPDLPLATVDDAANVAHELFAHLEEMDDTLRAAMASELGQEMRRRLMPERRQVHHQLMERSAPELPESDLDQLADLSLILFSSASYRAFKDYLGLSPDEIADRVGWALTTLVAGARARNRTVEQEAER